MTYKILSAVLAALIAASTIARANVDSMTEDDFFSFFESIKVDDGHLIVTRSNQDIGLKLQIGAKPAIDSPPESVAKLPLDVPCRFFGQEYALWLTPAYRGLGIRKVWLLEEVNRRGDTHVCILKYRRNLESFPKPSESFEIEPVKADAPASLRRLEVECTGSEVVPRSEEKK